MKFMTKILSFVFLCCCYASVWSDMTLGGKYVSKDSSAFMDILVTETGVVEGVRSEFLLLTNHGKANLDRCHMDKEVTSYGILNATATNFFDNLIICSGKTTLNSCYLQDLYILDNFEKDCECSIEVFLNGATKVYGSITFESGKGKVYKSPNAEIVGKVNGGTIIELSK